MTDMVLYVTGQLFGGSNGFVLRDGLDEDSEYMGWAKISDRTEKAFAIKFTHHGVNYYGTVKRDWQGSKVKLNRIRYAQNMERK